jgi:tetratricopeptide (TPR) repeat protein
MRNEIKVKYLIALFFIMGQFLNAQQKGDAVAEYRKSNYNTAIEICKSDISSDPNNLEAYIVICWSLLKLGRYNEVAVYAEAAAKLGRYDVRVIEILGELNYFQGKNNAALQYFQEYINFAPEGQRIDVVYYYMGEIYIRFGRLKHADIAFTAALYFNSGNAQWWSRLAYVHEMSGENIEAIRAYSKALDINSNLNDARRGIERVRAAIDGG